MDDIRWFAPDPFFALVVPRLRARGLAIVSEGDRPARLAIAMDARVAASAWSAQRVPSHRAQGPCGRHSRHGAVRAEAAEDEMATAYRSAEVVVCPSRFEGFGLTPMEAIACGRPVVVSDIPPQREFLGTAPRFFAVGDDDGLAAAIAAARSGPPARPEVLRALRIEAAAERFSVGLAPYLA